MCIQHRAQFVTKSRSPHVLGQFRRIRLILGLDVDGILSIYLAGVELSEILEKAYITRHSELGGA